jgi:3-oxoacyl-[acyl-carrier protein] reductase
MGFRLGATGVVLGGGRGIGRAAAVDLAAHGVHVIVGYSRRPDEAKDVVATIEGVGGSAELFEVDVRQEESVRSLFMHVREGLGRLDVLVNSAGIIEDGFVAMMSARKFDAVMEVNARGTFLACRDALKIMALQRHGAIVNVASTAYASGKTGQANYCASKGAVVSFTRALALEAADAGVRANCVAPGYIDTDMTRKLNRKPPPGITPIPLGRFGRPEEVAHLITFLASERASYMTGSIVGVDGGIEC